MKTGYVVLTDDYTIRGSEREQILFNLRNGETYCLEHEQFDFLVACTGTKTLVELTSEYDEESQIVISDFLRNLENLGAIQFIEQQRTDRSLPKEVVPDVRLEAVHLEASSRCNLQCAHCYQGEIYPTKDDLTIREIERVADEMREIQVQGISISGGEPFFFGNVFDIVRIFEDRDMRIISFFTNGILLNDDVVKNILACHSRPTMFISLDAITPEGMSFRGLNEIAGRNELDKILANIRTLRSLNISVVVNTVMNAYNIMHLRKMYDIIKTLGINSWRIGYPKQTGFFKDGYEKFGLPWDVMAEASFTLLKHHFYGGRPFHLQMEYLYREELFRDFQPLSGEDFVCDYERKRQSCCLKPNGDIVSCAYCTDFPIGNIRQQSLSEIWYSKEMRSVKEVKIKDVKDCQGYELRSYCATGCRINAYFLNGDFYHAKDDYACQAVRFFVDKVMPFLKAEGVLG